MLMAGAALRAGELVTVEADGSVWPTGWGVADPATAMTARFRAAVEPQLERLAEDTRAMWEHIKLLAIIDPERLPRDDWEATPHGLVATRLERDADRRSWEAIFALTHPDLETQLAVTKMHMILYRERRG
jgi:hypothetical protein